MDFTSIRSLMQMKAMNLMSGERSPSSSAGMHDTSFHNVLDVFLSASSPSAGLQGNAQNLTSFNAFKEQPIHIKYPDLVSDGSVNKVTSSNIEVEDKGLSALIKEASEKNGVDESLVRSVVQAESNFDANVVSHAGAQGLMQLMPETAKGLGVTDPFDPQENLMGGTKYLRQMMDRYNGDEKLALAAYNAGPGNVDKYGGIPPFEETQNYVKKIVG
ncbi:lytic transglycosylase domain-containing protein [Halobacillus seohaensis]|uniref:Lytic transglycosylase domain-containing protein n=1 Tax=Halobacillus seohaensis TaxID=447421 RepID=A0ABW2EMR1_9BACI